MVIFFGMKFLRGIGETGFQSTWIEGPLSAFARDLLALICDLEQSAFGRNALKNKHAKLFKASPNVRQ